MSFKELMEFLICSGFLVGGSCLIYYALKETKSENYDGYGNNIKLYASSIMSIMLGAALIFRSLF
jgi:hypothetical protein